jgi:hypothetical protein
MQEFWCTDRPQRESPILVQRERTTTVIRLRIPGVSLRSLCFVASLLNSLR